ncbi:3812_t:CDS:2 [Dentiscutata heterogama]|uniref:3812_t:CDS:1 n=1 Tax=Dentiscutata heterogama TaxID=1316150 RepID=A0ACA9KLT2_9GLOM|nr:3812_t:CDS:2 [Dentiscutata heterogama]
METFILLNDDSLIRVLADKCIKGCVKDNTHAIFKISLLSIIFDFDSFSKLLENHPAFIASFLTKIAFVLPSPSVNRKSTSHLSSHGVYSHLSKTSFIDILASNISKNWINFKEKHKITFSFIKNRFIYPLINIYYPNYTSTKLLIPLPNFGSYPKDYDFWNELWRPEPNCFTYLSNVEMINNEFYRYINGEAFYESHIIELRNIVIDIQDNKLIFYKKPYFSNNLIDALQLPEIQPDLRQIEKKIDDLRQIEKKVDYLTKQVDDLKKSS